MINLLCDGFFDCASVLTKSVAEMTFSHIKEINEFYYPYLLSFSVAPEEVSSV